QRGTTALKQLHLEPGVVVRRGVVVAVVLDVPAIQIRGVAGEQPRAIVTDAVHVHVPHRPAGGTSEVQPTAAVDGAVVGDPQAQNVPVLVSLPVVPGRGCTRVIRLLHYSSGTLGAGADPDAPKHVLRVRVRGHGLAVGAPVRQPDRGRAAQRAVTGAVPHLDVVEQRPEVEHHQAVRADLAVTVD